MDFNGSHEFAASQSKVYAAFFDTNILAAAIPSCREAKWLDPELLELIVELHIPGLNGTYEGRVHVTEAQEPNHFKLGLHQNNVQGGATIDAELRGPYKVADNVVGAQAVKVLLGQFFKGIEKQIS